jgi:hypothetical protein
VAETVDIHPEGGLAGRSAEVGRLRSAVRQVAGGTGRALLVVGEAGIGKTRVVAEGLAGADGLGVRVFEAAADELEQRRPFGVIAECLTSSRSATKRGQAAVAGLLGEDTGAGGSWLADAPEAEFRIVEGPSPFRPPSAAPPGPSPGSGSPSALPAPASPGSAAPTGKPWAPRRSRWPPAQPDGA